MMTTPNTTETLTILDGGMGRQLLRMGAPFQQPEWSALALIKAPELVRQAHEQFAIAGSDVITTNSYAVVPFHLGEARFAAQGASLAALSGKLAAEIGRKYGCRVAGCLPPLFGSYRPDLFIAEKSAAILEILIKALNPHVDLWLAETLSSIGEAEAVFDALAGDSRKIWVSFTLLEGESALEGKPRLRSGETVVETVRCMIERPASAMLFNCSQPELMAAAIDAAGEEMSRSGRRLPIGVYANAFASPQENSHANLTISEIRHDIDPPEYADFAASWYDRGATIIGGCCGIGPEHIQALCTKFKKL